MSEGVQFILPEKLTNITNLTSKMLLEEQQLGNPFVPNIPVSLLRTVYVKQLVAKFWTERVKIQKRCRLLNAYDMPDSLLARLFLECLMDQNWVELKRMKGNFLSRLNIPGNVMVTADLHTADFDDVKIFNSSGTSEIQDMTHEQPELDAVRRNTNPSQVKVGPIEIIEQHKDVHEAVRKFGNRDVHIVLDEAMGKDSIEKTAKDFGKKKDNTGKKWSLKRILMNMCPCMHSRKDNIEV